MNALIAYYSWSGSTKRLAELIAAKTGGILFEIRPEKPYSGNYNTCLDEAKRDIKAGNRPELSELPGNIDAYDTVFVGTPNWWSTIAPPVAAFLDSLDMTGKTIAPFCTHGGGGQARCASDLAKLCPDSSVLEGLFFAVYGGSSGDKDVSRWLERIGLTK